MPRLLGVLVALLVVSAARAQETRTLRATVTSISTESVFIDKGRADGVEVGMELRLTPPSGAPINAIVRAVSSSSSRADVPPGQDVPPVGTIGEIEVPVKSPEKPAVEPAEPEAEEQVPDHPPWSLDLKGVDPDAPLLAPVHGVRPDDRPTIVTGRVYFNSLFTEDLGNGRDNTYLSARVGTSLLVTNPFGKGGSLRVAGELDGRDSSYATGSRSETALRLERLSYTIGGHEFSPYRLEVGRYYSAYLPELGLIDGVEGTLQLQHGLSIGLGAGMIPLNNRERDWDGDFGVHAFVDYQSTEPGHFSGVLGYQKTWHDGEEDRDQVVGRVNWRVSDEVRVFGSMRADIYSGNDNIKGSGIELTEFWSQVRYTPTRALGGSLGYSRFRWPELLRGDYRLIPIEVIEDGQVDRGSVSLWANATERVRVSGNADFWEDSTSTGSSGDLRVDWNDQGKNWPALQAGVFFTEGSFNSGQGVRLKARKSLGRYEVYVGYELFDYEVSSGVTGGNSVLRHLLRGGVSWGEGRWYYSVTGDYYFGDSDEQYTLGVYASYRF